MVHISRVVNPNVTKELLCLSVLRYPRQSCKFYFFCLKKRLLLTMLRMTAVEMIWVFLNQNRKFDQNKPMDHSAHQSPHTETRPVLLRKRSILPLRSVIYCEIHIYILKAASLFWSWGRTSIKLEYYLPDCIALLIMKKKSTLAHLTYNSD